MADLQLITSKRDIYFATTAPEFIPKDFRIKGQENEYNTDAASTNMSISRNGSISTGSGANESNGKINVAIAAPNAFGHFSNERILEIKHKIEKIDAQQSVIGEETDQPSDDDDYDTDLHINTVDNLNKLLQVDGDQSPCIHRVRSLQKPKPSTAGGCADELRRQISKSSSCGDTPAYANCCPTTADNQTYGSGKHLDEPEVPPNSPKRDPIHTTTSTSDITISPIKYHAKSYQHHRTIHHLLHSNQQLCDHHGVGGQPNAHQTSTTTTTSTAEKIKPLRIFRIPLANLTGAHSHYHTHSSGGSGTTVGQSAKVSKIQSHKIAEDQLEVDATIARASAELNDNRSCKAEPGSDELKSNCNNSCSGSSNSCSGGSNHCTSDTEILSSL